MALKQSFKVRDFRNKGFFMVDDEYFNGYAKKLGVTTLAVYLALCRSADKQQEAFPSQDYIAEKLGVHRATVNRHIKTLINWKIIKVEKVRNHKGKFLHNTYFLLDKSEWKGIHVTPELHGIHVTPVHKSMSHQSYNKETHNKETHTLYIGGNKKTSIKGISEEDLVYVAEYYNVPLAFVKSKHDDLKNYCERTGHKYKNYLAALRHFVKQDAFKIKTEANNKSLLI